MPAILAVSTVGVAAAGCKDDDKTTTDAASETSDSGASSTTRATTSETSTTGPTSGDPTDTDGLPECDKIEDKPTCESTMLCVWPEELEFCTVDCMKITDEMVCGTQLFCFWLDGKCEMLVI